MSVYSLDDLRFFSPQHDFFIGIDSDGCVFDSMTIKQCEVFHPLIIRFWGLESVADTVRETAEFVNLRSVWRGRNRFEALLKTFELLEQHPALKQREHLLPDLMAIRHYVESGVALGNPSLKVFSEQTSHPSLSRFLAWSLAVNDAIASREEPIPPFKGALDALRRMQAKADTMVVSQTPEAALVREWREHGIDDAVRMIAGQELGSKAQHLRLAAVDKYPDNHILLIGDAPGDLKAARDAGVLFYPIVPDDEESSWQQFNQTILDRFLCGTYAMMQDQLVERFMQALPEKPDWQIL